MGCPRNLKSQYQVRSISLPCRSHPSTIRIEEELYKLKTEEERELSTPTAKTISNSLSRLKDLYKCTEDLLNLPLTQQALSHHQHDQRCVDDLQDVFVSLLDVCGAARDFMSQIKERGGDIQSSLRRRKADSTVERSIATYTCFRRKMQKDANKLITETQRMDKKIEASPILVPVDDLHVSSVLRTVKDVCAVSISVLHSLLLFLSLPMRKPKSTRRPSSTLVSKLVNRGAVACDYQPEKENGNELQSLDGALQALYRSGTKEGGDKVQIVQNSLKSLEVSVEDIENGLECLFRGLIKARASLLNTASPRL